MSGYTYSSPATGIPVPAGYPQPEQQQYPSVGCAPAGPYAPSAPPMPPSMQQPAQPMPSGVRQSAPMYYPAAAPAYYPPPVAPLPPPPAYYYPAAVPAYYPPPVTTVIVEERMVDPMMPMMGAGMLGFGTGMMMGSLLW
jgi:hypothetical protein